MPSSSCPRRVNAHGPPVSGSNPQMEQESVLTRECHQSLGLLQTGLVFAAIQVERRAVAGRWSAWL